MTIINERRDFVASNFSDPSTITIKNILPSKAGPSRVGHTSLTFEGDGEPKIIIMGGISVPRDQVFFKDCTAQAEITINKQIMAAFPMLSSNSRSNTGKPLQYLSDIQVFYPRKSRWSIIGSMSTFNSVDDNK
jgi:hypothetical protein